MRRMRESDGKLSRSNERKLSRYKDYLRIRLGAGVIFPEDRIDIPAKVHKALAFAVKDIALLLKEHSGHERDGRLYHLMNDIFTFEASPAAVKRFYYMGLDDREIGK
ncbi:hypothetical protein [Parabacteroides leei]|uniref:hypothetical protein n=2 Tax=Parabacteroides leei TaxID=2939491 RepID=UPI003241F0B2